MSGVASVTIGKLYVDGLHANPKGPLVLKGDKPVKEIKDELSLPIPVRREYQWVRFVLKGTNVDIMELLSKAHDEIRILKDRIYSA
jgi:hypothetical protein